MYNKTTKEYILNTLAGIGVGSITEIAVRKISGSKNISSVIGGITAGTTTWILNGTDSRDIKRAIYDFRMKMRDPEWVGN